MQRKIISDSNVRYANNFYLSKGGTLCNDVHFQMMYKWTIKSITGNIADTGGPSTERVTGLL